MSSQTRVSARTSCRSKDGVTVGLIDAIIAISRVLSPRLKGLDARIDSPVVEALKDLGCDSDLNAILARCPVIRLPEDDAKMLERHKLLQIKNRTPEQEARLQELHTFVANLKHRAVNAAPLLSDSLDDLVRDMLKSSPAVNG